MSHHTITVKELDDYLSQEGWDIAASSHGSGASKQLEISRSGVFRVTDHGTVTYSGSDKAAAGAAYNEAR